MDAAMDQQRACLTARTAAVHECVRIERLLFHAEEEERGVAMAARDEERARRRSERGLAMAHAIWNDPDPDEALSVICSSLGPDETCALAHEAARLRRELQALRGEPATADAFDVLSDVLDVDREGWRRGANLFDWMQRGWSPSGLVSSDSESGE